MTYLRDRIAEALDAVGATDSPRVDGVMAALDDAASQLSDAAHHKIMRMAGSDHACPIDGCRISIEEHHRLAYGILAENRELRRRVAALENG